MPQNIAALHNYILHMFQIDFANHLYWHGCTWGGQGRVIPASYSQLATSLRSLAIFLPYLPYTTQQYWDQRLQLYLPIYLPTRPYKGVCLYTIIALQFQICFAYGMSWITPFRSVMTDTIRARYHMNLRALIPSGKCLKKSIELRLAVTETI